MDRPLIPVREDGRWGYIDRTGRLAIRPTFSAVGEFQEGLARVCEGGQMCRAGNILGGKWGFIDPSGEYISHLRFDEGLDFEEGFAAACVGSTVKYAAYDDDYYTAGGKYGFVDVRGQWAMQPELDLTRGFREGLAPAMKSGKRGYLDRTFHWAIEPQYSSAYQFSDGLAAVQTNDQRWTYVNKQGEHLMQPRFDLAYSFSEGLAAGLEREDYRYIFLNRSFDEIFSAPAGVAHVGQFSEGVVWAILSTVERLNDGKLYPIGTRNGYGFLNRKGEWAIRPQFDGATDFSEGLACVKNEQGKYGYIRADGTWQIPARFSEAEPFRGGFAGVQIGDSYRVIDPQGNQAWSDGQLKDESL